MSGEGPGSRRASPRRLREITWRGWRRILWRAGRGVGRDSLPTVARGIAFSGVMALLPSLAAFLSLYGLFADASKARDHLRLLAGVVPASALRLIGDEMLRIATQAEASLSVTFAAGLIVAMWTANTGMKALFRGLNIAYGEPERRSSLHVSLVAAALTITAFVFLLATAAGLVALPLLLPYATSLREWIPFSALRFPLLFVLAVLGNETLYRFGASRPLARWRWMSVGSATAAAAWLAGSAALAWFIRSFGSFNATYGSLGAVFAVMIWTWLTALVVLIGARLNVEIERECVRAHPIAPHGPVGLGSPPLSSL